MIIILTIIIKKTTIQNNNNARVSSTLLVVTLLFLTHLPYNKSPHKTIVKRLNHANKVEFLTDHKTTFHTDHKFQYFHVNLKTP